jgi:hypothetical protein
MITGDEFVRLALSFEGATEAPHFDRAAFRVNRIFATLAPDRLTANLFLTPDEQEMTCLMHPEAFAPVPNKWGQNGATTVTLANIDEASLRQVLEIAWRHAVPKRKPR